MASHMSPSKGNNKPSKSKTERKSGKKLSENQNSKLTDSDISFELNGTTVEELKNYFENQLNLMKVEHQSKIDTLHRVLKDKDEVIGVLQRDIGELKKTCDFLTEETTALKGQIKVNQASLEATTKSYNNLVDKTSDLEDRSRRSNLVFFNIPESTDTSEKEDCETKVKKLIHDLKFFDEYDIPMDRVHRIGRKQNDTGSKPRPVIVKFTYYKDKEHIIRNGHKFKNSVANCSEDFSRNTLEIHKELRQHAKAAQEKISCNEGEINTIKHFKVTYRRVVLTYTANKNNPSAPVFTRSFSLKYIRDNTKWYMPPKRNTYSQVQPY